MRYFIELSYNGTRYSGWQKQPTSPSVQQTVEKALSTILRIPTEIVGCGRTDTGVHAQQYFLHFDFSSEFPPSFIARINKYLPPDIAFKRMLEVAPNAHARFDATHRAYEYHISFHKNPFGTNTSYHYPHAKKIDQEALQEAAQLLLKYDAFFPFCKSNSDAKTMNCRLHRCEWVIDESKGQMVFYIGANRFLRGMVRLIVGMCLNVAIGKLKLETVRRALDQQTRLERSLSAPPQALYLTDIRYPFLENN